MKSFLPFSILSVLILGSLGLVAHAQEAPAPYISDFESGAQLPPGWTVEGKVTVDATLPYQGKQSLFFSRTKEDAEKPCTALSPAFKVIPGLWDIKGGVKPDLYSPDSSFEAVISFEYLDAGGKSLGKKTVSNVYGKKGWAQFNVQVEVPKTAATARFAIQLNKTYGQYWVDELSATYAGPAPVKRIDRLVFSTVALGNLLYPSDSRVVSLHVETFEELPEAERVVHFGVRDYWGAEQMETIDVPLIQGKDLNDDKRGHFFVYEGTVDLAKAPLEQGKYYEMYGEIPQKDKPFRNYSGLAIEPEAITNSYKPEEIPFSSRNWDGSMADGFHLSHRMGIRIINIWSGWESAPPYKPKAPCIDLVKKYGMAPIFGTASHAIEGHLPGWEKYDDKALRGGIRNLLETYGKDFPTVYISLGNEPAVLADRIPADIKAYQSIYEEAKKVNPSATVIGTSIGPSEEFFKAGMGKYLDVYDFHTYEDPKNIGMTFVKYDELFKKYGNAKPIWSTEIGLNSQGVARHAVAVDMIKKFAYFFAGGGQNLSWFDLFYPDPNAKNFGSNGESFDVFDSRYIKYNPKITAIAYFDLINTISTKKFIAQKIYGTDLRAYLFRDKDNHNLQIIWKEAGGRDVQVPLAGAQTVEVIKLDGTHRKLQANGKGVTLSIGEEPLLLLYDGTAPLADDLGTAPASLAALPEGIVRGGSAAVTVNLAGTSPDEVNLLVPPFWKVEKFPGKDQVNFKVNAPVASKARAAELTVTIGNGQATNTGELYLRLPVTPQIASHIEPLPPAEGQAPSVKLTLKNNSADKQDVSWALSMVEENALVNGAYDTHRPTKVHFTGTPKGRNLMNPGAVAEIVLPLEGTDPLLVYRVRAVVTQNPFTTNGAGATVESSIDASGLGETSIVERNVAGFVAVPKAATTIKLDGILDEADWKRAPVEKINEERQYFGFGRKGTIEGVQWKGTDDLSGTIRYLWDDKYLYVGVEVTDDKRGALKEDSALWQMDGLQFLVDPCRDMDFNVGKYDYVMGVGKKGPQAWCSLSADAGAPNGEAKDIVVSYKWKDDKTGAITYELAIPWSRLAPFKPAVGADLGLTMILNEDDGNGRKSFMCWFGNAHSKQVDGVGDLILAP